MIRLKALSLIKPSLPNFKASDGWLRKFLSRNNLVLRAKTSMAQMLPCDLEEKIDHFRQNVRYIRESGDFPYNLIANMDETPAYFDTVPSKTVDKKGKKSIIVRTTKSEKRHITAVLSCTATGDMLPPMIIFKGTTTRSIASVSDKNGAIIAYQEKGWMNEEIMKQWITTVWMQYTQRKPSLLVLDSFSAHVTDEIKSMFARCNTTVIVIPGGCTSVLQPLDVSINRPFKDHLRKCWQQYMVEQSDLAAGSVEKKIPPPSKQHLVDWITGANRKIHLNSVIVKKSFLVTGLSNALGGHEDHLIRNDLIREEIQEVLTEVFGDDNMGFEPSEDPSTDPFASDSDSESDSENGDCGTAENISVEGERADTSSDESTVSFVGPDFEPIYSN